MAIRDEFRGQTHLQVHTRIGIIPKNALLNDLAVHYGELYFDIDWLASVGESWPLIMNELDTT
jgi:hypothetical protein